MSNNTTEVNINISEMQISADMIYNENFEYESEYDNFKSENKENFNNNNESDILELSQATNFGFDNIYDVTREISYIILRMVFQSTLLIIINKTSESIKELNADSYFFEIIQGMYIMQSKIDYVFEKLLDFQEIILTSASSSNDDEEIFHITQIYKKEFLLINNKYLDISTDKNTTSITHLLSILKKKGYYAEFDEALKIYEIGYVKKNIIGNIIKENLNFQIKTTQKKMEKIDVLLNEFLNSYNYNRKDCKVYNRINSLYKLVENLIGIFEINNYIEYKLFKNNSSSQLTKEGLEKKVFERNNENMTSGSVSINENSQQLNNKNPALKLNLPSTWDI
ncbi:hypothetical protein C1646_769734 [Rhizophagus diaphanus]|nr:hypothetical protein C1646_769734 [Rhizophagus diaphanus] [Rhizophagus sp. MUCL 43196]